MLRFEQGTRWGLISNILKGWFVLGSCSKYDLYYRSLWGEDELHLNSRNFERNLSFLKIGITIYDDCDVGVFFEEGLARDAGQVGTSRGLVLRMIG